ncbi:hypothetical protein L2E82_45714 [Cichorium intybus]|uniref:Uncharacterized protein n=1 Tax=Cichorium intybus TaxID=13427 RepID=A0ACB8ZUA0_CICIN|nr:hypothetical protein L2E82_45714 [Cichorium intybus]
MNHDGKTLGDDKSKQVHGFYESQRADLEASHQHLKSNIQKGNHRATTYGLGRYEKHSERLEKHARKVMHFLTANSHFSCSDRAKLTKEKGNKPSSGDVFRQTQLKKSAKLRLASGESIGSQPEHWVNKRSWTVFDTYEKTMSEKYGPEPTQFPLGDAEIREHSGGGRKKGRV